MRWAGGRLEELVDETSGGALLRLELLHGELVLPRRHNTLGRLDEELRAAQAQEPRPQPPLAQQKPHLRRLSEPGTPHLELVREPLNRGTHTPKQRSWRRTARLALRGRRSVGTLHAGELGPRFSGGALQRLDAIVQIREPDEGVVEAVRAVLMPRPPPRPRLIVPCDHRRTAVSAPLAQQVNERERRHRWPNPSRPPSLPTAPPGGCTTSQARPAAPPAPRR